MNNGGGTTCRADMADDLDTSDNETVEGTLEDRTVDAFELNVTMGFGETDDLTCIVGKRTETSTFDGVCGPICDTGVSYVFQGRSKKAKGNNNWGKGVKPDQHTPRVIGLSKSLGGDANVYFGHADPDQEDSLGVEYRFLEPSVTPN